MFRRRALLAPVLGILLAVGLGPRTAAAAPDRQVILIVVADTTYREVLSDPRLLELSSAGGLGLVTTSGGDAEASLTAVNIGAGRSADDAPGGPVPYAEEAGGLVVDVDPYMATSGDAVPGLLGTALSESGMSVAYLDPGANPGAAAMLSAMDDAGRIPIAALAPDVPATATEADLVVTPEPDLLASLLEGSPAEEVLVVLVGTGPSDGEDRGTPSPIVLALGAPEGLLAGGDGPTGLTSSTTRRAGIVSDVDVAPTILEFLDAPIPEEMVGAPIEPSGEPPTGLHDRYLDHRSVVGPVGATILAVALGSLFAGLGLVFVGPPRPGRPRGVTGLVMVGSLALFAATVPASILPSISYATVAACLLLVAAGVLAPALWRGRRDPRATVATTAVAGLAFVALDGAFGWPSQLTPLLGGGVLDGERFFGLGNAHAGIVLAGAVLGAARMPGRTGVWLIAGAAAFAGLPFFGADLGGSLAMACAAALWFGLRTWRNLGWRTWGLVAATAVGTFVLVTMADRSLPAGETHVSSAFDGGAVEALLDRLAANVRTTTANTASWLAVLGLPFWLVIALRGSRRLRPTLELDRRWRDAVVVLTLAGIAGYLLNDTYGLAGSAFAFTSAAMLYPTLAGGATAGGMDSSVVGRAGPADAPRDGSA